MNQEQVVARRRFAERLTCTVVFTAVQLAATAVVVVAADVDGVVALALAFVLAGGLVAVHDAWRDVLARRQRATDDPDVCESTAAGPHGGLTVDP